MTFGSAHLTNSISVCPLRADSKKPLQAAYTEKVLETDLISSNGR